MDYRKPGIFEVNILYLVLGVALLVIGGLAQSVNIYGGLIVTEYILILLPSILFLKFRGYPIRETLRLKAISFKQIIYITFIMIFSYPIAVLFNSAVISLISRFGEILPSSVPIPESSGEFLLGVFVIALAPGICEEVMFRGVIMRGYESLSYKKNILITSILFGMFHFNIMNFAGPIFLGIILAVLVYKTDSLFASIYAHFLNNFIALSIGYSVTKYVGDLDELANSAESSQGPMETIASLVFLGILILVCIGIVLLLIKKMPGYTGNREIYEYNRIHFADDGIKILRFLPVVVVITVFIVLNYLIFLQV